MGCAKLRPKEVGKRDILAAKFELETQDVLHLKKLYKRIYEWVIDEGFESSYGDKYPEILYLDRAFSDGSGEHHIWWRATLTPKKNSYYRYFLKIDYQTLNGSKTEVMHKGQKFKANKVNVILRIEAWLQLDYKNNWQDNAILRHFEQWFRERFFLDKMYSYKRDLYRTVYKLNSAIKQYLQFKSPYDWGQAFHAEKGIYHSRENLVGFEKDK
ncbi:MAG: hypothetical protein V1866_03920 [archaeon]